MSSNQTSRPTKPTWVTKTPEKKKIEVSHQHESAAVRNSPRSTTVQSQSSSLSLHPTHSLKPPTLSSSRSTFDLRAHATSTTANTLKSPSARTSRAVSYQSPTLSSTARATPTSLHRRQATNNADHSVNQRDVSSSYLPTVSPSSRRPIFPSGLSKSASPLAAFSTAAPLNLSEKDYRIMVLERQIEEERRQREEEREAEKQRLEETRARLLELEERVGNNKVVPPLPQLPQSGSPSDIKVKATMKVPRKIAGEAIIISSSPVQSQNSSGQRDTSVKPTKRVVICDQASTSAISPIARNIEIVTFSDPIGPMGLDAPPGAANVDERGWKVDEKTPSWFSGRLNSKSLFDSATPVPIFENQPATQYASKGMTEGSAVSALKSPLSDTVKVAEDEDELMSSDGEHGKVPQKVIDLTLSPPSSSFDLKPSISPASSPAPALPHPSNSTDVDMGSASPSPVDHEDHPTTRRSTLRSQSERVLSVEEEQRRSAIEKLKAKRGRSMGRYIDPDEES
ncbi:hypothetical protein V865_004559 [Kwoniella europaea PYCC6329]|uniref:Uncharacterized protein n=1 Tax=Kwoniella europaea PYCC6329 TaxID=1423913 RepID=A0AAX4KJZ5_9TREE